MTYLLFSTCNELFFSAHVRNFDGRLFISGKGTQLRRGTVYKSPLCSTATRYYRWGRRSSYTTPDDAWHPFWKHGIMSAAVVTMATAYTAYAQQSSKTDDDPTSSLSQHQSQLESTSEEELKVLDKWFPVWDYVIVGGGYSAWHYAGNVRQLIDLKNDGNRILMISDELDRPYKREVLSKELLWSDDYAVTKDGEIKYIRGTKDLGLFGVFRKDLLHEVSQLQLNPLRHREIRWGNYFIRGHKVVMVDKLKNYVLLDTGQRIYYRYLVVATGATPNNHAKVESAGNDVRKNTILFRPTIEQLGQVKCFVDDGKSIAVLGNNQLATETALGIKKRSMTNRVVHILEDGFHYQDCMPRYLAHHITEHAKACGIECVSGTPVKRVTTNGGQVQIEFDNDELVKVDKLIVCNGTTPNVELNKSLQLPVDARTGGYRSDFNGRIWYNIFTVGECNTIRTNQFGHVCPSHFQLSSIDHQCREACLARTKDRLLDQFNPSFWWWSQFPNQQIYYQSYGRCDSSMHHVGVFKDVDDVTRLVDETTQYLSPELLNKGVVFYLDAEGVVRGLTLWNQHPYPRQVTQATYNLLLNQVRPSCYFDYRYLGANLVDARRYTMSLRELPSVYRLYRDYMREVNVPTVYYHHAGTKIWERFHNRYVPFKNKLIYVSNLRRLFRRDTDLGAFLRSNLTFVGDNLVPLIGRGVAEDRPSFRFDDQIWATSLRTGEKREGFGRYAESLFSNPGQTTR